VSQHITLSKDYKTFYKRIISNRIIIDSKGYAFLNYISLTIN